MAIGKIINHNFALKTEEIEEFRPKETKRRNGIMDRQTKAKTFKGWIEASIKLYREDYKNIPNERIFTPNDFSKLLEAMRDKYKEFVEEENFYPLRWRGKSGVEYMMRPDVIIAIRWKKKDRFEEPKEVRVEMTKKEINEVLASINRLFEGEYIKTSEIAEETYKRAWKSVFSDRKVHIKLTEILNYLEHLGKIEYSRGGKIKLIQKKQI